MDLQGYIDLICYSAVIVGGATLPVLAWIFDF
ncbi:hypothetical protein ACVMIH_000067 [Bradyrhizobium sp. USDA 4503]